MIYNWKKILKNSIPLLMFCVFVEISVGQIMQSKQDLLLAIPVFLVSIPVVNGVGGNLGSVIGARLASSLHVGVIEPNIREKKLYELVITSIIIGFITYFTLAILIYLSGVYVGLKMDIKFLDFIYVLSGSGVLLILLITTISILTAFTSFKKGFDPDDWVAPVVTTAGDTLGVLSLFLFIKLIGVG